MATGVIAGRSTSTLMRITRRVTTTTTIRSSARRMSARIYLSPSIHSPNLTLRQSRISPPPKSFLRRELSSLLPVHTAIASACLVSKLPSEASTSAEGRFANYLSPI